MIYVIGVMDLNWIIPIFGKYGGLQKYKYSAFWRFLRRAPVRAIF